MCTVHFWRAGKVTSLSRANNPTLLRDCKKVITFLAILSLNYLIVELDPTFWSKGRCNQQPVYIYRGLILSCTSRLSLEEWSWVEFRKRVLGKWQPKDTVTDGS